jgi:RNA polymerase sigma factor (sigma-70 family)
MLSLHKTESDPEELFARNYARLLRWALQLTGGDRATAEDLLHDVFILFTLRGPNAEAFGNLDAYLYTMLRNLHVSRLRRQTRARAVQLSVVEFDSAEAASRTLSAYDRVRVREELGRVCRYACARKERAKSACALILRFFHGYYPSEAARVLRTSRPAVDVRLREARAEARLFLESPERLGHLEGLEFETEAAFDVGRTDDLLQELRQTVFRSRRGDCMTRECLGELYDPASVLLPTQAQLAHVVSCAGCLEEVNRLLGLAPLSERNPADSADREPRGKGGDGGTGAGGAGEGLSPQRLRRLRRQAAETFEHRPRELCVSVNGYLRGAQRVTSETSELDLIIDTHEPLDFVEVLSEQDVRLLLLPLTAPPEGDGEQSAGVSLSDGRRLEISLHFRSLWPALHLLYHDPTFDFAEESSAAAATPPPNREAQAGPDVRPASADKQGLGASARLMSLVRRLFGGGFWLRPGALTAALALILVAAILVMRTPDMPGVSAAELLRRSAAAEESASGGANTVMFRAFTLEETAGSKPPARRRVEVWKSAERGLTVRRLYDEHGQLLAGEWRGRDGASTVYRAPAAPASPDSPWDVDAAWQFEPSAADFRTLTGSADTVRVEESDDAYLLTYEAGRSGDGVSSATLTVRRRDLHATEQTLVVREAGAERRLRFAEVSYERRPKSSVPASSFEPDAPLLSPGSARVERPAAQGDAPRPAEAQDPGRGGAAQGAVTPAALEVEVLGLLNRAGADMGEQVSVSRTPQGSLHVRAIVDTDARKAELLRALAPVASNPAVRVEVATASEAARQSRQAQAAPEVVQEVEPPGNRVAADAELRRYFSERGGGGQLDSEIIRFAVRESARSRRALQHAWALKRLAARFDAREFEALDEGARLKLLSMIGEHAEAVRRELAALEAELQPVFSPSAAGGSTGGAPIGVAGLADAADQLLALCSEIDPAVRSAFAVSNGGAAAALKSPRFWRALSDAKSLAGRVARGARR